MNRVLSARRTIKAVVALYDAAYAPWYLAGGVSLSNVVTAYSPEGAANLAASYVNLANPGTHNLGVGKAPNFGTSGWICNNSPWLTTDIVPTTTMTVLLKFTNCTSATGPAMGCSNGPGTNVFILNPRFGTTSVVYAYGGTSGQAVAPVISSGVIGMTPKKAWRNGVDEGITLNGVAIPTTAIYLCANNAGGSPAPASNVTICKFVLYNIVLTSSQILAISTAMAA